MHPAPNPNPSIQFPLPGQFQIQTRRNVPNSELSKPQRQSLEFRGTLPRGASAVRSSGSGDDRTRRQETELNGEAQSAAIDLRQSPARNGARVENY